MNSARQGSKPHPVVLSGFSSQQLAEEIASALLWDYYRLPNENSTLGSG